ncbi:MAG: hypothetical protein ABI647_01925 [Gemmatimonadota bacterium]
MPPKRSGWLRHFGTSLPAQGSNIQRRRVAIIGWSRPQRDTDVRLLCDAIDPSFAERELIFTRPPARRVANPPGQTRSRSDPISRPAAEPAQAETKQ